MIEMISSERTRERQVDGGVDYNHGIRDAWEGGINFSEQFNSSEILEEIEELEDSVIPMKNSFFLGFEKSRESDKNEGEREDCEMERTLECLQQYIVNGQRSSDLTDSIRSMGEIVKEFLGEENSLEKYGLKLFYFLTSCLKPEVWLQFLSFLMICDIFDQSLNLSKKRIEEMMILCFDKKHELMMNGKNETEEEEYAYFNIFVTVARLGVAEMIN
jgi:hypothetical protein